MSRLRGDVFHIPNGVTPLSCSAQGRHLFSHGRLASHKRLDLLLDALAQPVLSDAVLHIVGPDWDVSRSAVREHAIRRGVADRVCLHGAVSAARLCEIASDCGVFVCASEYEGFGMALIEALSAGLTAVVAPNAAFKEIMRYAPVGQLADFRDPASAARAIRNELDQLAPATREAARSFADKYSWPRNAAGTLQVYEAAQARQRIRAA
jgi:alpha-1,3-mannosyltransferase